jgi:hypothetical protein
MAYGYTVTRVGTRLISGRTYHTFKVVESDTILAAGTTEWQVTGVPVPSEIVLFEAKLVTAGGAATIQPELGYATGWTDDTLNEVAQVAAAASHVTVTTAMPLRAPDDGASTRTLYGRSIPNGNTDNTGVVHTYLTIREGIG